LNKKVVDKVVHLIKLRLNQEKIAFLKGLPAFKPVSQSKVKAMIDQFKPITKIRGSYLFQEGDIASHVYIVVTGEFKIIKKVPKEKPAFYQNTDVIFKDPLKAKR